MQLLLLLAAMTVAGTRCAQLVLQHQDGRADNRVEEDGLRLKFASPDQIVRADVGDRNLLKVAGVKHTPSYEWTPATRTGGVFGELVDDEEDTGFGQQADTESEMLSRLLTLYDMLPAQTSKWRERRRRQDEEVQPGMAPAGQRRQCHVGAPYCSDNLSSVMSSVEQGMEGVGTENAPSEGHSWREGDKVNEACCQEQDSGDGHARKDTDGPQTEVGQAPQKEYYPFNSSKRATSVDTAWRRTFNSWGGKRNPSVHGWDVLSVLANIGSWGASTATSLGSRKVQAVNSRTRLPVNLGIRDEPAFAVLRPKRNGASDHDYRTAYGATPAHGAFGGNGPPAWEREAAVIKRGLKFSAWGGKRYFDGDRQGKRGFSSWSGKRNLILDDMPEDNGEGNKRTFSSWGGKRDPTKTEQNLQNSPSQSNRNYKGERGLWHADTQTSLTEAYRQLLEYADCRTGFRCEGSDRRKGNGEELQEGPDGAGHGLVGLALKRSDSNTNRRTRVSKTLFTPWRGKRGGLLPPVKRASVQYGLLGSKKWGSSPSGSVFSTWAGKRSDTLTGHNTRSIRRLLGQTAFKSSQKW